MSHVHEGPLATYNSLLDPHLAGYFSNTQIRRHLKKAKLITRKGEVITESKYRLLNARAEHRKQVREMLAQAIVNKAIDMERQRQSEVRQKLERIQKIEMVKRVKAERRFGYEDTIMDLLRSPREVNRRRQKTSKSGSLPDISDGKQGNQRPSYSAQSNRSSQRGYNYISDGAESNARSHSELSGSNRRSRSGSRCSGSRGRRSRSDSKGRRGSGSRSSRRSSGSRRRRSRSRTHSVSSVESFGSSLSSEKSRDGRHISRHVSRDRKAITAAEADHSDRSERAASRNSQNYTSPTVGAWKPRPPAKKPPPGTPRDEHGRPLKSKKRVKGRQILHRQEPAFKHEKDVQTFCEVTLKYLGGTNNPQQPQEITVEQQHCGGNTLTVFREFVKPKCNFVFTSKRHVGFPFGLTLYIDGRQDATVSTCCEYRHRPGTLLGSKTSHFLFVGVTGAKPCYKCEVEAELATKAGEEKKARDKRKKKEEKQPEEKQPEEKQPEEEQDQAEAEDEYDEDFDEENSEKEEPKIEVEVEEEDKECYTRRSCDADDEYTSREIKGYDDELEPVAVTSTRSSAKSPAPSKHRSSEASDGGAVRVDVNDSEEEFSSKEIVEHYLESMSRESPADSENERNSHRPEDDSDAKSSRSSKSSQSIRSAKSEESVKSERSSTKSPVASKNTDGAGVRINVDDSEEEKESSKAKQSLEKHLQIMSRECPASSDEHEDDSDAKSSRSSQSIRSAANSINKEAALGSKVSISAAPSPADSPLSGRSVKSANSIPDQSDDDAMSVKSDDTIQSDHTLKPERSRRPSVASNHSTHSAKSVCSDNSAATQNSAKSVHSSASKGSIKSHASKKSGNSVKSDTSKTPKLSEKSKTSHNSDKSHDSIASFHSKKSGNSVKSTNSRGSVHSDRSNKSLSSEKSHRSVKSDASRKSATSAKSTKSDKSAGSHRSAGSNQSVQSKKSDKPEEASDVAVQNETSEDEIDAFLRSEEEDPADTEEQKQQEATDEGNEETEPVKESLDVAPAEETEATELDPEATPSAEGSLFPPNEEDPPQSGEDMPDNADEGSGKASPEVLENPPSLSESLNESPAKTEKIKEEEDANDASREYKSSISSSPNNDADKDVEIEQQDRTEADRNSSTEGSSDLPNDSVAEKDTADNADKAQQASAEFAEENTVDPLEPLVDAEVDPTQRSEAVEEEKDLDSVSVKSAKSDKSASSHSSRKSETSVKSNGSKKSDVSVKSNKSVSSQRSAASQKSNASAKSSDSKKSNNSRRSSQSEKSTKSDFSRKSNRSVRSDKEKPVDELAVAAENEVTEDRAADSDTETLKSARSDTSDATLKSESEQEQNADDAEHELNALYEESSITCSGNFHSGSEITANNVAIDSLEKLLAVFEKNDKLNSLILKGCSIGDKELEGIVGAIRTSDCDLKVLDVSSNEFSVQGAMSIVQLMSTKSLKDLRLSGCSITRLGVAEIVKTIAAKEMDVRVLYLDECTSGDMMSTDAIDNICKILHRGQLKTLVVSHITAPDIKQITKLISEERLSLDHLAFPHCLLADCTSNYSCPVQLKEGVTIELLSLAFNGLSDTKCEIILKNCKKADINRFILVPGNHIEASVAEDLIAKFHDNEGSDATSTAAGSESGSITAKPPLPPEKRNSISGMSDSKAKDQSSVQSDVEKSSSYVSDESDTEGDNERKANSKDTELEAEVKSLIFGNGDEDDITDISNLEEGQSINDYLTSAATCISLANLSNAQMKAVCKHLKNSRNLRSLKLRHVNLGDEHMMDDLCKELVKQDGLKELVLAECGITAGGCGRLKQVVETHVNHLEMLSLRGNELTDRGAVTMLSPLLNKAEELFSLSVNTKAKEIVKKSLQDAVKSASLTSIVSHDSSLSDSSADGSVPASLKLSTLVLSKCKIGNATLEKVIYLLNIHKLSQLRLAEVSDITQFGWKDLFKCLKQRDSVVNALDISGNALGRYGISTGSPLLGVIGLQLESLNLADNLITDAQVQKLVEEFEKGNTGIRELRLDGNSISSESMERLKSPAQLQFLHKYLSAAH